MSDGSGATLLSYALTNMESLGGAAYQNAEFKADVTYTAEPAPRTTPCRRSRPRWVRERRGLRSVQAALQLGHLQHLRPGVPQGGLDGAGRHLPRRLGTVLLRPAYPSLK